ncbi:MAG TPA: hypothetical protein VGJ88_09500, partial [Thermoanaerobaculia bacterium]
MADLFDAVTDRYARVADLFDLVADPFARVANAFARAVDLFAREANRGGGLESPPHTREESATSVSA